MLSHVDNILSAAQVLTATAASTNYIDLNAVGAGFNDLMFYVFSPVILDSAGDAATLTIAVQSDTDSGFATALKTHYQSSAIAESTLTAGKIIEIPIPRDTQRYIRLYYTVGTENFTTGSISANVARPDYDNG